MARRIVKMNWYVMKPVRFGIIDEDPFSWEIRCAPEGSLRDWEMATMWTRTSTGELVRTANHYAQFRNKRAAMKYIGEAIKREVDEWWERWEWERHRDGI